MAKKKHKAGRSNGSGTLEVHGRTYRARYYKADPASPTGFSRVAESTGIHVDGSDPEDLGPDGSFDPKKAKERALKWLEQRTMTYRLAMEKGKLVTDGGKLAGVMKSALAKVNGAIGDVSADIADADEKLPAFTLEEAWEAFAGCLESQKRDPATQKNYGQWYHLFADWLAENHPEASELRNVTAQTAREYAQVLLARVRGTTYNRHLNALSLIWSTLAARDLDGPSMPRQS